MSEGRITFWAMPTPSWDPTDTVTVGAQIGQSDGAGSMRVTKELSLDEARAFAKRITDSIAAIETEQ